MRTVGWVALALLLPGAAAQARILVFDSYQEIKGLTGDGSTAILDADTPFRLDGLLPDRGGGVLDQSLTFVAGVSDISMSAGWRIAPPGVRTVGVNIDLLDSTDTVIASDLFSGVVDGLAQSSFTASGLTPGATYTLLLTGTAQGAGGRYQIDLAAGTTAPPIPPTPVVSTSAFRSKFDTLEGEKELSNSFGGDFAPGDAFRIDALFAESGAIDNSAIFRVTGDTLSAGVVWRITEGFQRTVGVNVDLLDSFDIVVASDTFTGVANGQAFSEFVATGLTPGDYTLVFTGTAQSGGRYRIALGTGLDAPRFDPLLSNVPEPQTWALLVAGFGLAGSALRRRRAAMRG